LKRSGEGEKGRCLPWSKEEEGAYIFWMKQVSVHRIVNKSYAMTATSGARELNLPEHMLLRQCFVRFWLQNSLSAV